MPKRPPKAAADATGTRSPSPPSMKAPPMDEMQMRFGGKGSGGMAGPRNKAQDEITKGYGMTPQNASFPEINPHKKWFSASRAK